MNIYGKEIYIDARAGKILLESDVMKKDEYKWLTSLLKEDERHIVRAEQVECLEDKYKTFLTSPLYEKLYTNASNEWEIYKVDDSEEKLACSLCGQKDTKRKFYIRNKINDKVLNVGSTCIDNFRNIRDNNGKTAKEVMQQWEKQKKIKILNDKYPGIIEEIDKWDERLENVPTIVKENLENDYETLYSQIQELLKKWIKEKKEDYNTAKKINELVNKGKKIIEKCYEEIDKNKNNEWYISEEIKKWCYKDRESNKVVIAFLKEDGLIKWRSACRIYEKNFVNMILQKLRNIFSSSCINIREFNELNNSIIINIIDGNPYIAKIDLECKYIDFMRSFGNLLFGEKEKDTDEKEFVIGNSEINNKDSINISISNIQYLLDRSHNRIERWDVEYNEIAFLEDKNNYLVIDAKEFINNFIKYVFNSKLTEKEIENINKFISENGKIISKKEYMNTIRNREKVEKAMKVDYSKFV